MNEIELSEYEIKQIEESIKQFKEGNFKTFNSVDEYLKYLDGFMDI